MRRMLRVGVGMILVWALSMSIHARSQGHAAARFVVFEAFMRPT